MEMRSFEKTDWDAFAGAEGWADHPPLFGEGLFEDGAGYILILGRNSACLVLDDDQAQYGGYILVREFRTVEIARAFAERLGAPRTRYEFFVLGFNAL